MAKRNVNWSEDKFQRYIKEGRGMGESKDYRPWLVTQDFPSMGIATRVMGHKTNRMHHFFSNTQLQFFYLLEWNDNVVDIREHYPLLDLMDTLKETDDLRMNKFTDRDNKTPYIITTTFLITFINKSENKSYAARSVKYASELSKKITLEKLEIERRYWGGKSIDWGIVTNKEINSIKARNIEWLHSEMLGSIYLNLDKEEAEALLRSLFFRIVDSKSNVKKIILEFEQDYGLDNGTGLSFFKFLLAKKLITVDMGKQINLNEKTNSLIIEFKEDWK